MQSQLTRVRGAVLVVLVPMLFVLLATRPVAALAQQPAVTETPIQSTAPDAGLVKESYVSLYDPLPAADGPHPAACDRVGYLRFRSASGPSQSKRADAIFVAQPGIFEGAGAFDQVARNTIEDAQANGENVEFWAINRRSNCLNDTTGLQAAIAAHDPQVAFDYYYKGTPINGQTFAGFTSESNARWLSHVGMAQTVDDEYALISQIPRAMRTKKVFCGGHSLGGIITGAFADWNFGATGSTVDAGYNQCAGYFALETRLQLSSATTILSDSTGDLLNAIIGTFSYDSPYVNFAPITPETEYSVPILGMASYWSPNTKSSLLAELPVDANFNNTFNLLLADNWTDLIFNQLNARALNATNQAVIGEVFDDNSQPFNFLRASLGAPSGGPLVEKNFPFNYGTPENALSGGNLQVATPPSAAVAGGPLYTWLNYNQIPTPGPSPTDDPGHPFTSAASEVSDIGQFSRTLFEGAPALFTEPYFPTQLVLDTSLIGAGDRSGGLAGLQYTNGITQHPSVYVDGGEGLASQVGGEIPDGPSPQVHITAAGYNHLDVLTAARVQNNGQPEPSSSTLASWVSQIIGAPRG